MKKYAPVQVNITVPASILKCLASITNNDDYQKNEVIADWLQSQVDVELEILDALEALVSAKRTKKCKVKVSEVNEVEVSEVEVSEQAVSEVEVSEVSEVNEVQVNDTVPPTDTSSEVKEQLTNKLTKEQLTNKLTKVIKTKATTTTTTVGVSVDVASSTTVVTTVVTTAGESVTASLYREHGKKCLSLN